MHLDCNSLQCVGTFIRIDFCVFSPFLFQLHSSEVWCFRTSVKLLSVPSFSRTMRLLHGSSHLEVSLSLHAHSIAAWTELRVLSTAQSRNRTSTESDKYSQWWRIWCLCECWRINVEKIMATAEQVEALQQLPAQGARIAALETQLRIESARAQTAEQKRSALIQTLGAMRTDRDGTMIDVKGIGQPFMWKGTADQDFGEWVHKVRTFMLARFGDQILTALTWAARQRKIVVKTCVALQRDRFVPWITVFGEQADEDKQIDEIDDFDGKFYAYLVSFTTDAPNGSVRNSGEGKGLEAWRRLHGEYDPTPSMRRVAILQQVQNPPRCQRVEDSGSALEDWLSKKRQYEMFTDRNGRPCQASDDSLVAAMFRLMPRAWKRPSCSPMRTRASRSCSIDCWPTTARNSQSK